jgi:hypothetical protein
MPPLNEKYLINFVENFKEVKKCFQICFNRFQNILISALLCVNFPCFRNYLSYRLIFLGSRRIPMRKISFFTVVVFFFILFSACGSKKDKDPEEVLCLKNSDCPSEMYCNMDNPVYKEESNVATRYIMEENDEELPFSDEDVKEEEPEESDEDLEKDDDVDERVKYGVCVEKTACNEEEADKCPNGYECVDGYCEKKDTDTGDTGNTGDTGDTGNTGDTGDTGDTGKKDDYEPWTDTATGFMWSKMSKEWMIWSDAVSYCETLIVGEYSQWRLPSISELRTLVENCPQTETDGACGVTDSCLSDSCSSDSCEGCEWASDGKYSKMGNREYCWSSSVNSDNDEEAWFVNFYHGYVQSYDKGFTRYALCVR